MRTARNSILSIAAISSIAFIVEYVRVVTALFPNADPTHLVLFTEPQITVYRPWTHAGVHGGYHVSLFNLYGLTPDGTVPVFRFPDWPFLILAIGVLVYAIIRISRRKTGLIAEPSAPGNAGERVSCRLESRARRA